MLLSISSHSACHHEDVYFIEELLSHGLDIDVAGTCRDDRTLLMAAAMAGQLDLFCFLIARGSDHTLKDNLGRSLLHFAAIGGSDDIIEHLLFLGLDIDLRDKKGHTPLMYAALFGQPDTLLSLMNKGSDPGCTSKNRVGGSLLHLAAAKGKNDNIEILLFLGLDIDSRDNYGRTPLMIAACKNQLESFLFLIEIGSDPLLKDRIGRTVLFWAEKRPWQRHHWEAPIS